MNLQDIGEIQPTERTVEITNPQTGAVILTISLLSPDDKRMKPHVRRVQERNLQLQKRGKMPKPEEIEENEIALLSAAIVGWKWAENFGFEGKQPEFDTATAQRMLKKLPWMVKQIDEEAADYSSFFRK